MVEPSGAPGPASLARRRGWRGAGAAHAGSGALSRCSTRTARLRYKCLRHGSGLRPIDGGDLTGRYLDEFFPEPLRTSALAAYDATVTMACPIYTLRNAVDAHQVPVTFERIRLPLSEGDRIDHLLTHVEIFCEGGRYQRDDLLKAGHVDARLRGDRRDLVWRRSDCRRAPQVLES